MHINDDTASSTHIRESTDQIAGLRDAAQDEHIAAHIRGMVAATMGNLSVHTTDTSRADAAHWQAWALAVADGLALPT